MLAVLDLQPTCPCTPIWCDGFASASPLTASAYMGDAIKTLLSLQRAVGAQGQKRAVRLWQKAKPAAAMR